MPNIAIAPLPSVAPVANPTADAGADKAASGPPTTQHAGGKIDFAALLGERFARLAKAAKGDTGLPSALPSSPSEDGKDPPDETVLDPSAVLPILAAQVARVATARAGTHTDSTPATPGKTAALPSAAAATTTQKGLSDGLPGISSDSDRDAAVSSPPVKSNAMANPAILAANLAPPVETTVGSRGHDLSAVASPNDSTNIQPSAGTPANVMHPAAEPLAVPRVDTPVGAARWGEELAQKVVWFSNHNETRAELTLNPPQMGKLEVTLTMTNSGETHAVFVSPSAHVRDAIEQSLPRLREVFAEAGIALGQASVNDDAVPRDQRHGNGGARRGEAAPLPGIGTAAAGALWRREGNGLVDTFA